MREISLTQGKITVVDDEDFDRLSQWRWHARKKRNGFYACRNSYDPATQKSDKVYMHHVLISVRKGEQIDHRDGDTLNNQKSNLRRVTRAQNLQNVRVRRHSTTGFVGVHFDKNLGRFTARIKNSHLGCYDTAEEAARSRDDAARKDFGEFGTYNFPREGERAAR